MTSIAQSPGLNILAFDTSGTQDSIAILHNGIISHKILPTAFSSEQSSRFIPEIITLIETAKIGFSDIDILLTISGPGSFTGIRLGLATAQGLTFGNNLVGKVISKFDLLAFQTLKKHPNLRDFATLVPKNGQEYFYKIHKLNPEIGIWTTQDLVNVKETPLASAVDLPLNTAYIDLKNSNNAVDLIELYLTPTGKPLFLETLVPYYLHNPKFKKQNRFIHE